MKNDFFEKIGCQEPTWVDLGSILGRSGVDLGRPRGVKMSTAEGQKRCDVEWSLGGEVE